MATDKHLSDQSRINDDAAPPRYRRVWSNVVKPRVFLIPRRWHGGSEFHKHKYNTVDLSITTLYLNPPCFERFIRAAFFN